MTARPITTARTTSPSSERRCHRPSSQDGVQPVRQRRRLYLRRRGHGLHAVSAEHARHDRLALQHPGSVLPEALIPGRRGIGTRTGLNLWGSMYPRGGFTARPTTTRAAPWSRGRHRDAPQPDTCTSPVSARDGCWPAGALMDRHPRAKWRELTPTAQTVAWSAPHNHPRCRPSKRTARTLWRRTPAAGAATKVFIHTSGHEEPTTLIPDFLRRAKSPWQARCSWRPSRWSSASPGRRPASIPMA